MTCGKMLSIVSTSFENRFNIRPIGVVSNNSIAHRSTFVNKFPCIAFDDRTQPSDTIIEFAILSKTNWIFEMGRINVKFE